MEHKYQSRLCEVKAVGVHLCFVYDILQMSRMVDCAFIRQTKFYMQLARCL